MSINIKPAQITVTRSQTTSEAETLQPRIPGSKTGWQSLNYPQWQPNGILGGLINPPPPPPPPGSGILGGLINPAALNPPPPGPGILGGIIKEPRG